MASVNFMKIKTAEHVKSLLRHCDKNKRLQTQNHSNQQINKNLTSNNLQYNMSYEQVCKRFDDRIKYLDSLKNQNKRKDRVLCFSLEIPCPAALSADKETAWVDEVNKILLNKYSKDNVMNVYYHADEKHMYYDAETSEKRESRNHLHAFVVPCLNDKLNAKEFSSKKNMIQLNNEIQLMTQQKFNCDFMNNTKKKSNESVESLKNKSKQREFEALTLDLKHKSKQLENDKNEFENEKNAFEKSRNETLKQLENERFQNLQMQQQMQNQLENVRKLYDKSKNLHSKLMNMSDIFLDKYADSYAHELKNIKETLNDFSL